MINEERAIHVMKHLSEEALDAAELMLKLTSLDPKAIREAAGALAIIGDCGGEDVVDGFMNEGDRVHLTLTCLLMASHGRMDARINAEGDVSFTRIKN